MKKKPLWEKIKFPKIDFSKIKAWKPDFSKVNIYQVIYVLCIALSVLLLVGLAVLLLAPDDGIPEIVIPTIEATEGTQSSVEGTIGADPTDPTGETQPREMLPKMAALYAENPDVIGWVTIPDTKIDYPVMYTPEEPNKYLYANFKGKFSIAGMPFIDAHCSMDPESDNLILYAHNMNNGTMFENLMNYESKKYWQNHPLIQFSTLYEERTYEIIYAFRDKIYDAELDVFKFYKFIDPESEEEFDEAMAYFAEKSTYDTGLTATYGDKLITLVTCAYHTSNGRFVVVAREVTPEATPATE